MPAVDAWGDAIAAAPERIPAPRHAARAAAEGAPLPPRVCAGPGRLRVAVVGAGKVGCSLGRYLGESAAVNVAGFCSRDEAHAREAVEFAGGSVFASPIEAVRAANLLLVTTPDTTIAEVWDELARARSAFETSLSCIAPERSPPASSRERVSLAPTFVPRIRSMP